MATMLVIRVPPELERIVGQRAEQQGTTPELVVLDALRQQLLPPDSIPQEESGTLADLLGDMTGCLDSGELVPGGAQMSHDIGKKFANGMVEKRGAGRA
jgi:hypothetical protein